MKKSRLSYDDWTCIEEKKYWGKHTDLDSFQGYIGIVQIQKVSAPQLWHFNGEDILVCDAGLQWLSILPEGGDYCIAAMMDARNNILLWYIDMIAGQGVDPDGVVYFDDLYLDLVVYPDGTVMEDDLDELEAAFAGHDISEAQFRRALNTAQNLKNGMLRDIDAFRAFTQHCLKEIL